MRYFLQSMFCATLFMSISDAMMSPLEQVVVLKNHEKAADEWSRKNAVILGHLLSNAIIINNKRSITELLQRGARIDVADANGDTPLHIAWKYECYDLIPFLCEHGADLDAQDAAHMSVLHHACKRLDARRCFVLLGQGALTSIKDADGYTPLHTVVLVGLRQTPGSSREKDALKIIKLLLAKGSRELFYAQDNLGKTVLEFIQEREDSLIARLLRLYREQNNARGQAPSICY